MDFRYARKILVRLTPEGVSDLVNIDVRLPFNETNYKQTIIESVNVIKNSKEVSDPTPTARLHTLQQLGVGPLQSHT
jgi:hypothetical protein